jgi:hypothetical protein
MVPSRYRKAGYSISGSVAKSTLSPDIFEGVRERSGWRSDLEKMTNGNNKHRYKCIDG